MRNGRTEPGPELFLDSRFREGFRHLAPRGLSFEGWCYHPQIPGLTELARAFPDTTIILDHFGGPLGIGPYAGRGDEVFADWRRAVGPLAECPNVCAKLGGIAMDINGFGWHEREAPPTSEELMEATRRYYEHTIAIFGAERCMFESNFPVDKLSCSYRVLWNSFKRLTAGWSAERTLGPLPRHRGPRLPPVVRRPGHLGGMDRTGRRSDWRSVIRHSQPGGASGVMSTTLR